MPGYIYLPIATPEMREFATDWQEGQRAKGQTPNTILQNYESGWRKGFMRKVGLGVLRNVIATDTLYILAHGSAAGSRRIGAERGGTKEYRAGLPTWDGGVMKSYTPAELAVVIKAEGLLTSFVDLRVFTCGSGLTVKLPEGEERSFAERLCNELVGQGYSHIRVTGYAGAVRSSYAIRSKAGGGSQFTSGTHRGVEIDGSVYKSSEFKVVFRSQGGMEV